MTSTTKEEHGQYQHTRQDDLTSVLTMGREGEGKSEHIFFFNDTATTEIYTLSLHDALPISHAGQVGVEGIFLAVEDDIAEKI